MDIHRKINVLCIAALVLGIVVVDLASENVVAEQVKIGEIGEGLVESRARVNARIVSRRESNGNIFLELYDGTGKIKAVAFNLENESKRIIRENNFAEFEGKIKLYKNELEIVVDRVREWR